MFKSRYERKFIFQFEQVELLLSWLNSYSTPHRLEHSGIYPCKSIYFDTPQLDFFNDHINGERSHTKLRVRSYEDCTTFLEVKIKTLDKSFKRRNFLKNYKNIPTEIKGTDDSLFGEMCREISVGKLIQTCLVVFDRDPYEFNFQGEKIRLTLDRNIFASAPGQKRMKRFLPTALSVVELKCDEIEPLSAFQKLLNIFKVQEATYSKYCEGMKAIL